MDCFAPGLRRLALVSFGIAALLAAHAAAAQDSAELEGLEQTSEPVAEPPPADADEAPSAPAEAPSAPADTAAADPVTPTIPVEPVAAAPDESLQVKEQGSSERLDTVEVTGSRIRRTDYETAQPIAVLTRADIARTGLTNVGELLARIPSAGTTINTAVASVALSGGETNLDLRNLGTNRVLVLVDGHRWVNGLTSVSTSAVDLNTIPTSIIERIEVLKDGASAVYGSDAIAGVVNIITRKDYAGVDLSSQVGGFQDGDGMIQQHQLSFGKVWRGTSVFANLSYTKQDEVKATDRYISSARVIGAGRTRWSTLGPEGRFTFVATPANAALLGTSRCQNLLGPNTVVVEGTAADPAAQVGDPLAPGDLPGMDVTIPGPLAAQLNMIPTGAAICDLSHDAGKDNSSPLNYHARNQNDLFNNVTGFNIQNPSERTGLFVQVHQEVLDDISFDFQGLYNVRRAAGQIGFNLLQGGDLAGLPDVFVSESNRYNPFGQDIGRGVPPAEESPIGAGIGSGLFGIRLMMQPRVTTFDNDTLRLGGAFKGAHTVPYIDQLFSWDLGYSYSSNKKTESGLLQGLFLTDRLARAVGPDADCTGDCVPFNVFSGQEGITQAMLDYVAPHLTNHAETKQEDAFLNITTELARWPLPAGPVGVAVGLEYRRDQYQDEPDRAFQEGNVLGNLAQPTRGENSAKEAFVELAVPIIGDLPFVKLIDLSLAGRYSEYQLSGTAKTGKAGLRWQVYDDLLLRGTLSSAFRAPSVGELFLGDTISFEVLNDPCSSFRNDPTTDANCDADGVPQAVAQTPQTQAIFGGNRGLDPEKARTLTYGFVFSNDYFGHLEINADYYSIDIDEYIDVPGSQLILDACYKSAQRSYCQFVHRNANGTLDFLENRYVNLSAVKTSGIDGAISYTLPLPESWGRHNFHVDASYLLEYEIRVPVPGEEDQIADPGVGESFNLKAVPRWKANTQYLFGRGPFSFSWSTRLVYHRIEGCVDGRQPPLSGLGLCSDPTFTTNPDGTQTDNSKNRMKTAFYHNVQFGYEFAEPKLNVTLGVNNLLNLDTPISRDPTFGGFIHNYDFLTYETPGRFPYLRVGMKF